MPRKAHKLTYGTFASAVTGGGRGHARGGDVDTVVRRVFTGGEEGGRILFGKDMRGGGKKSPYNRRRKSRDREIFRRGFVRQGRNKGDKL